MKYNGVDPRTLHPGISIAKEIPPGALTSQLETLSGSSGEIIIGRTIQQAEYIVRINIAGKNKEEAWRIRKLLAGWACAADTQAHPLIPTHWDTVSYDAILKEITPPEFKFGFATVDVIFALPRPIAVDTMENTAIGASGEGVCKPMIEGTSYARPTITAYLGSMVIMRLYVGSKCLFGLSQSLAAGTAVEISTNPPNVRYKPSGGDWQDGNALIDYTRTDFQALAEAFTPGEKTVTCAMASQINVTWRDEWV